MRYKIYSLFHVVLNKVTKLFYEIYSQKINNIDGNYEAFEIDNMVINDDVCH